MNPPPEYKILETFSAKDLEKQMNVAAKEGFEPLGEVQVIFTPIGSNTIAFGGGTTIQGISSYVHKMIKKQS